MELYQVLTTLQRASSKGMDTLEGRYLYTHAMRFIDAMTFPSLQAFPAIKLIEGYEDFYKPTGTVNSLDIQIVGNAIRITGSVS